MSLAGHSFTSREPSNSLRLQCHYVMTDEFWTKGMSSEDVTSSRHTVNTEKWTKWPVLTICHRSGVFRGRWEARVWCISSTCRQKQTALTLPAVTSVINANSYKDVIIWKVANEILGVVIKLCSCISKCGVLLPYYKKTPKSGINTSY